MHGVSINRKNMINISLAIKQFIKKVIYFILSPYMKTTGPNHSVYITFDDGPHQTHTIEILEILKEFGVTATFFYNGSCIEKYPDIVSRVINEGHQVGYHSYEHESMKGVSISDIYRDLRAGRELLSQYGVKEFLYRPPYGDLSIISLFLLIISGWKIIMWSVEGRDSFDTEEEIIYNLDARNISKGSIILLHDVYGKTPKVLPVILKNLINSNFEFDALSYK